MTYTPIPAGTPDWDVPVNAAFTDQDARITTNTNNVTALQAQGSAAKGVYVPPNWGEFWRAKRNNSGAVASKIMCLGDSITQGFYTSNPKTASWPGLMRTSVQNLYGNGGTGMFSVSSTQAILSVDAGIATQWQANNALATTTGTPTTGIAFGPGISHLRFTNTGSITFNNVVGTTVRLWYITGGAPRANWTYQIDGGAVVPVPSVITATSIAFIDITGLANTGHTVVISWNGTAGDVLDFIGVAGYNGTGVIVDNMGRSGTKVDTAQWGNPSLLTMPWNGGVSNPADLVIISLGVNDAIAAETSEQWTTGMGTMMNTIKAANNGATDIILVHQHYGSTAPGAAVPYTNYASRLHDLADNYNAAVVNMWTIGRNSWDYWNSLGFWGSATAPAGPTGTNSVHPGDAGHAFIASMVTPLVLS